MLLIYIPCENFTSAEKLGRHLLSKKLSGCINIIPHMEALFFWPQNSATIERTSEAILLIKTFEEKFDEIQKEVEKIHSYEIPCIVGLPLPYVSKRYEKWLRTEMGLNI